MLVEILPLMFQKVDHRAGGGRQAVQRLQLTGRDIYIREGCYNCHSQMIRPFRAKPSVMATTRWRVSRCTTIRSSGAPSAPVRTWPVSAAAIPTNGTASTWSNPRDVVPESNMPAFPVALQEHG